MFSTTKGVSALAIAVAAARGLISYDAKVADYWPEFAHASKGSITVRQLLSHQGGLPAIDAVLTLRGPKGGRITTATLRDATSGDDVVTELGYEQLKRHGLRHTGLTWLADAGVPVHILRKIARHGTLTTTQRYLHPDRQSVTNAGDLLSRHLWSPNGPQLRVISS